MAGQEVSLPVQPLANANENAVGFSLELGERFSLLELDSVAFGADAQNELFVVNTGEIGSGRLGIAITGSNDVVVISWPDWATDFVVQQCSDPMDGTSSWEDVESPPQCTGGFQTVTLPVAEEQVFFRPILRRGADVEP